MKVSKNMIEYNINIANSLLKELGVNTYELEFNSRNGYKAIDKKMKHGSDTLETGLTTRETYQIINALVNVLADIKKEVDKSA